MSHLKTVGEVPILEGSFISAHVCFIVLNFSFELHTVLWDFDKKKFFMLMLLDRRVSVKCVVFPACENRV